MTREAKQDLIALRELLAGYTLTPVLGSTSFQKNLTQQHGRYLALLVFLSELTEQITNLNSDSKSTQHLPSIQQFSYLQESVSDIGQSVFCWVHGAYKGSRIMLRSSIECFVKGIVCHESPEVLTETRVYKVFEIAATATIFGCPPGDELLTQLRQKYSDLCADAHTALPKNMSQVSALNHFPTFVEDAAKGSADQFNYVTARLIVSMSLAYNRAFHNMHHRNKEIVLSNIPSSYKRRVQNVQ